nr:F-box/FBD/LRR-repeat protein At1g13570-like [Ipomoea batatas]
MARKLKTRDLISELPVEVKDRILECLPIRDAARTALLSRHWNHVWLHHERLKFDFEFLQSFQNSQDDEVSSGKQLSVAEFCGVSEAADNGTPKVE